MIIRSGVLKYSSTKSASIYFRAILSRSPENITVWKHVSKTMQNATHATEILHERHHRRYPGTVFCEDYCYEVTLKFFLKCKNIVFPIQWGEYLHEVIASPGRIKCCFWINRKEQKLVVNLPQEQDVDQTVILEFRYMYPPEQKRMTDNIVFFRYESKLPFETIFPKGVPFAEHFHEVPNWSSEKIRVIEGQREAKDTHRFVSEIRGARGTTHYYHTETLANEEKYEVLRICRLSLGAKLWLLLGIAYGLSMSLLLLFDLVRPLFLKCLIGAVFRDVASILMVVGAGVAILIAIRSWFMFRVIEISEQYRISNIYLLTTLGMTTLGTFLGIYYALLNEYAAWLGLIAFVIIEAAAIYLLQKDIYVLQKQKHISLKPRTSCVREKRWIRHVLQTQLLGSNTRPRSNPTGFLRDVRSF